MKIIQTCRLSVSGMPECDRNTSRLGRHITATSRSPSACRVAWSIKGTLSEPHSETASRADSLAKTEAQYEHCRGVNWLVSPRSPSWPSRPLRLLDSRLMTCRTTEWRHIVGFSFAQSRAMTFGRAPASESKVWQWSLLSTRTLEQRHALDAADFFKCPGERGRPSVWCGEKLCPTDNSLDECGDARAVASRHD